MSTSVVRHVILLILLAAAAVKDYKKREIPLYLTLGPILIISILHISGIVHRLGMADAAGAAAVFLVCCAVGMTTVFGGGDVLLLVMTELFIGIRAYHVFLLCCAVVCALILVMKLCFLPGLKIHSVPLAPVILYAYVMYLIFTAAAAWMA